MATSLKRFDGTVSHGTMRPEDLIPAFVGTLKSLLEAHRFAPQPVRDRDALLARAHREIREIEARMDGPDYYDSEASSEDLDLLFTCLDGWAPEGFTFGAHPGDGSDYGFWQTEED